MSRDPFFRIMEMYMLMAAHEEDEEEEKEVEPPLQRPPIKRNNDTRAHSRRRKKVKIDDIPQNAAPPKPHESPRTSWSWLTIFAGVGVGLVSLFGMYRYRKPIYEQLVKVGKN